MEINIVPAPGVSSGDIIEALKQLASDNLPQGYTYDWGGVGTDVGANELIVKSGAVVVVDGVYMNADYFGME